MQPQSPVQKRTVQHIVHVTYHLLYKNYFDVITVQQICEEAEINRSTFYRYFEDKYDLLYYLAQYIGYLLKSRVNEEDTDTFVEAFVSYFEANKKIFRHLFTSTKSGDIYQELIQVHSKLMFDESCEKNDDLSRKIRQSNHPEMLCDFMSAGLIEVLKNWVDNNYDDDAVELYHFFKNTIATL